MGPRRAPARPLGRRHGKSRMAFDSRSIKKAEKKTPLLKLYVYATKGGANVDPSPSNSAAVGTLNGCED